MITEDILKWCQDVSASSSENEKLERGQSIMEKVQAIMDAV